MAVGRRRVGLLIAPGVIRALVSFLPTGPAGIDLVTDINLRVFGFALGAACVTAVLFSLAPAFRAARAHALARVERGVAAVGGGVGLRKVLVIAQIALALVLLIGAGLFVRTLASLRAKGPGFATTNQLILAAIDAARSGYEPREPRGSCARCSTASGRCRRWKRRRPFGRRAARRRQLESAGSRLITAGGS